jgi:hypothetical protein
MLARARPRRIPLLLGRAMHIKDMIGPVWQRSAYWVHARGGGRSLLPVALDVVPEEPVSRPEHLLAAVQQIKATPWYRGLRKRGLHFVPLGHREGAIVVVVSTIASLGASYLLYKRIKQTHGPADVASEAKPRALRHLPHGGASSTEASE